MRQSGKQPRDLGKLTADDLLPLRAQLVAALGQGVARVNTPQLGEVEYRTAAEIVDAIAWIDQQTALLNAGASTFIFQSNRGTEI